MALFAAGTVGVVAQHRSDDTTGQATATSPAPFESAPKLPPREPFDASGSVRDQVLADVFVQAHDATPAEDIIRTGGSDRACREAPPGISPRDRVRAQVGASFGSYTVLDVARVIDRFAGLCVLDLRAREPRGTVLVVRVVSPIEDEFVVDARVDDGVASSRGTVTQFVRVSTRDGWVITVGTSGPRSDVPMRSLLTALAEQQSLRW